MGMYNEVYMNCPNCNSLCMIQVPQVVYGFGEFHIFNPNHHSVEDLTLSQREELAEYVNGKSFYCENEDCDQGTFEVEVSNASKGCTKVSI